MGVGQSKVVILLLFDSFVVTPIYVGCLCCGLVLYCYLCHFSFRRRKRELVTLFCIVFLLIFVLFVFLLYDPSHQLWSWRDDQFT